MGGDVGLGGHSERSDRREIRSIVRHGGRSRVELYNGAHLAGRPLVPGQRLCARLPSEQQASARVEHHGGNAGVAHLLYVRHDLRLRL
eukprot:9484028-Pyramimonas_sp.AAC.1